MGRQIHLPDKCRTSLVKTPNCVCVYMFAVSCESRKLAHVVFSCRFSRMWMENCKIGHYNFEVFWHQ